MGQVWTAVLALEIIKFHKSASWKTIRRQGLQIGECDQAQFQSGTDSLSAIARFQLLKDVP